jgi:hypothetical protein
MDATKTRPSPLLWLALAAIAALLALGALSRLSLPKPSPHAVAHHGEAAHVATRRLCYAEDCDVWSRICPDGRRYTIRELPGGDAWDVSVDAPSGDFNFTRFTTTNANWVAAKLAWCDL